MNGEILWSKITSSFTNIPAEVAIDGNPE